MIPLTKKLSPCLTLKTVCTDKFKTERISVVINDSPDARRMPVTKFVFSVLKCGCKQYPTKRELNKRLDELYSSAVFPIFSRGGGKVSVGFGAEMLGNEYASDDVKIFEGTLELLFKLLFEPVLDEKGNFLEKYVEREREDICDSIRSVINVPRTYAIKRLIEVMYEGDDFAVPSSGTVEIVESISTEELMSTYSDLIENSSYEVFYIGAKTAEEVEECVKKYFERYSFGAPKTVKNKVDFSVDTKKIKRVDEEMKLSQGILTLGYKTGVNITCGREFYAALVLNEIFGGSPVSKLFMNVRERMSLCYYCGSRFDPHKGLIYVSSGIEKSDRKKAEKEIIKQFNEIVRGNVDEAEFSAAKKSIVNVYSETTDSASGIERFYSLRDEYGVSDSIEEAKMKINAVSLEEVIEIAKKTKLDTVYFLCGKENCDE